MPAETTRLAMTKQDMRKGRKTGSPVSRRVVSSLQESLLRMKIKVPGCSVESTIFFAFHNCSFMCATVPDL